jgi:oxalate decarboxylase/phosphoglucose isomerase-like protein (cupin superfamily)
MYLVRRAVLTLLIVLFAAVVPGRSQQAPAAPVKPVVDPQHLRMQPDQALDFSGTTLNVAGDPAKPGIYVIRRRFKPGEMSRPHIHNQDRFVTVIKGTWWTGEGDVFDPAKTVAVKTGGFMLHPKGLHHYDGAKDEEVIVQIIGMGPVTTTETETRQGSR